MRKTVLTFGLISGVVLSAMLLLTLPFHDRMSLSTAEVVGYATMVAASLLIYFGVRRYRDVVGGGRVSFGRAVAVGGLIAVLSGACYTATWEVVYFKFAPDYIEQYNARVLKEARAHGTSQAELDRRAVEMAKFAKLYHNPLVNIAMTFLEPLPVGLVVTLISAGLLSRRRKQGAAAELVGVV
jgi:hypothetical protein